MNKKKFLLVFFLLNFFLSAFYIDWGPNWNTASRIALPLAVVLENKLDIDTYKDFTGDKALIDGKYYSDKAPLPGLMMIPILKAIDIFYDLDALSTQEQVEFSLVIASLLFGSLPFALIVLLSLQNQLVHEKRNLIHLYFAFFGSFLFVFSGTFFSHVFAGLLLILSYRALQQERFLLSGCFFGMCFMTEYLYVFAIVVFGLDVLVRKKTMAFLKLGAGFAVFFALQLGYNYLITGNIFDFAYKFQENFEANSKFYGFALPSIESLFHLSISSYRGVLFYTPFLLIIAYNIVRQRKVVEVSSFLKSHRMALVFFVVFFLLIAGNKSWYGGWTYGPRYLYASTALVLYAFLPVIKDNKLNTAMGYVLGCFGLLGAFLCKFTVMYPQTGFKFPLTQLILPNFLKGDFNERNLLANSDLPWMAWVVFALCFVLVVFVTKRWQGRVMEE